MRRKSWHARSESLTSTLTSMPHLLQHNWRSGSIIVNHHASEAPRPMGQGREATQIRRSGPYRFAAGASARSPEV